MTDWYWVRHGPTHERNFVGWRDVPADLSDHDQLERLRDVLPVDAVVVSSDLIRCSATADAIGGDRYRLPDNAGLREIHFGAWDGLHWSDPAIDPDLARAFWDRPGDVAPPGGESWNAAANRARPVVDALNKEFPGRTIIAVAHFGIILTQVQRALDCSAAAVMQYKIDNLSVTHLSHSQDRWQVHSINQIP